jgi:anti-sigma factor RsiW
MTERHLGAALDALIDGELSVDQVLEAERHLASCAACRQERAMLEALRGAMRAARGPRPELSATSARALHHAVRPARRWRPSLLAGATALAAVLIVGLLWPRGDDEAALRDAHLRSLQAEHLTDVASSDRHTVKPWFQGRVPFGVPADDFAAQGFTLQGGRLEVLNGEPAAALVYRARQHVINAFVQGSAGADSHPSTRVQHGLSVVRWQAAGLRWALVSDASPDELERLAALLRGGPEEPPHRQQ